MGYDLAFSPLKEEGQGREILAHQRRTRHTAPDCRAGKAEGVKRHDSLPFGEEMTLNRTPAQDYVTDSVRQGFGGYEEDTETGLDYAQARYFSAMQGRFISVDPLMASARTEANRRV